MFARRCCDAAGSKTLSQVRSFLALLLVFSQALAHFAAGVAVVTVCVRRRFDVPSLMPLLCSHRFHHDCLTGLAGAIPNLSTMTAMLLLLLLMMMMMMLRVFECSIRT